MIFRTPDGVERLSAYSQVPVMTLDLRRRPRDLWPKQATNEEIGISERIVLCGGSREWAHVSQGGSHHRASAVDALWRSTPKELREAVLDDISKSSEKQPLDESGGSLRPHITGSTSFLSASKVASVFLDPNDHFQAKLDYASSTAKVDLLMGKLSLGTRRSYMAAWKHWCLFRRLQGKNCWMDLQAKLRDEDLLDWIIHEWHIMHLSAGSIRAKLSGIRYMHMISGYGDLNKAGGRAGLTLSAIGQRELSKSKLPSPSELAQWIYENL